MDERRASCNQISVHGGLEFRSHLFSIWGYCQIHFRTYGLRMSSCHSSYSKIYLMFSWDGKILLDVWFLLWLSHIYRSVLSPCTELYVKILAETTEGPCEQASVFFAFQGVCTWMGTLQSSLQGRYTLPPLKPFLWLPQSTTRTIGKLLLKTLQHVDKNIPFIILFSYCSSLNGISADVDTDAADSTETVDLLEGSEGVGDGASTPSQSAGNSTASISASGASSNTSAAVSPHDGSIPLEQLKQLLSSQLEYYFSRWIIKTDDQMMHTLEPCSFFPKLKVS